MIWNSFNLHLIERSRKTTYVMFKLSFVNTLILSLMPATCWDRGTGFTILCHCLLLKLVLRSRHKTPVQWPALTTVKYSGASCRSWPPASLLARGVVSTSRAALLIKSSSCPMSKAVRFRCQPPELLCERPGLNPELLHPSARPPGLPSDLLRTSVLPGCPPQWTGQSSL